MVCGNSRHRAVFPVRRGVAGIGYFLGDRGIERDELVPLLVRQERELCDQCGVELRAGVPAFAHRRVVAAHAGILSGTTYYGGTYWAGLAWVPDPEPRDWARWTEKFADRVPVEVWWAVHDALAGGS
jgi:hypothetical protein